MLDVITNKLSEKDLDLAIKDANREKKAKKAALLKSVAESANWNIDAILSDSIQLIRKSDGGLNYKEAKVLRCDFRKVLIAKKYGISERYNGNVYWVGHATDDCIIIQCEDSNTSLILSPTGELLMDEGKVKLNVNSLTNNGYNTHNKHSLGLYSKKGKEILPCIFDEVDNKLDGHLCVTYKNVKYDCNVIEDSRSFPPGPGDAQYFAFDGGVVSFSYPMLLNDRRFVALGVYVILREKENLDLDKRNRIKKENELISKVGEELFEKMAATHHWLSKEEICQLRQES